MFPVNQSARGATLATSVIGDWLRDTLDPTIRTGS